MTAGCIYLALHRSHLSGEASLGSVGQSGVQAAGHASSPTFLVSDLEGDGSEKGVSSFSAGALSKSTSTWLSSWAASLACCVCTVAGRLAYTHLLSSFLPASLYLSCSQQSSTTRSLSLADV